MAALALLLTAACATAPSGERELDQAVRQFNEIAFGVAAGHDLQFDDSVWSAAVFKWDKSITVSIFGTTAGRPVEDAHATLADFAEITGREVVWLANGNEDAALRIRFTGERDFVINDNEVAGCFTESRSSAGRIGEVDVFIGLEADGSITDCLTHELMHAFGFHGHAERPTSVLSDFAPTDELTPWDRLALRTLYDSRLRPGMPRDKSLPLARDIIERLLARR